MKEAGVDCTKMQKLTRERKTWRQIVRERVNHIEKWQRLGAKEFSSENRGERNASLEENNNLTCEYCNMTCSSKTGLDVHVRSMHEMSSDKVNFECIKCKQVFKMEVLSRSQYLCSKLGF